jgi:hypothetical protein
VVIADADGAYPATEIGKLWQAFEDGEDLYIAAGERSSDGHASRLRRFASFMNGLVSNLIAKTDFVDQQCGAKMYRTDVAQKLFALAITDGYGLDHEIGYLAHQEGYGPRTVSVPVEVTATSRASHVNPYKEAFRLPAQALKMRWHHSRLRTALAARNLVATAQEQ